MALTKAEMSEYLFESLGLASGMPKNWLNCFSKRSVGSGKRRTGETLGFGNFDLRDKNQRPGRNPKTGEDIPITARRVVTFRPGQKLKSGSKTLRPKTSNLI